MVEKGLSVRDGDCVCASGGAEGDWVMVNG